MSLPKLKEFRFNHLAELGERCEVILGSKSPRRKMFMELSGVQFRVVGADIEEILIPGQAPDQQAIRLSEEKARAVGLALSKSNHSGSNQSGRKLVIIGSDTIVWFANEALGKPIDAAEAKRMLRQLSGQIHTVYTSICLLAATDGPEIGFESFSGCAQTDVTFNDLSDEQISEYVATGDPLDKAGAYGAQEHGAFLVDHMIGDLDTVIGFPRALVDQLSERALRSLDETL